MAEEKKKVIPKNQKDSRTLEDFQFYQIPDSFIKKIMPQSDTTDRKLVICIFASNNEKVIFYSRLQKALVSQGLDIYLESWVFPSKDKATMIIDDQMLLVKHPNVKTFRELEKDELKFLEGNCDHKVNSNKGMRTLAILIRNILSQPPVVSFIDQNPLLKTKYKSGLQALPASLLSHRITSELDTTVQQNNNNVAPITSIDLTSIQSAPENPKPTRLEVFSDQGANFQVSLDRQIEMQPTGNIGGSKRKNGSYSGVLHGLKKTKVSITNGHDNNSNQEINQTRPVDIKALIKTYHVETLSKKYYFDTPQEISEFEKLAGLKKHLSDELTKAHEIYIAKAPVLGTDKSLSAFARVFINKGSILGEYTGKKTSKPRDGFYTVSYVDEQGKMRHLDGEEEGNWLGRINHSKYPNAKFVKIENDNGEIKIAVEAIYDIAPEEQILVDYRSSFVVKNEIALNPSDGYFTPSEILSHYKQFYHSELLSGNKDINLQDPYYGQNKYCIITNLAHYLLSRNLRSFQAELEEIQTQASAYQILHLPILMNFDNNRINLQDAHQQQNTTVFHLAVKLGETAFVELLLKYGVYPNQRQTLTGDSAFHLLAATPEIKNYEKIFGLLHGKALINMVNLKGDTALHTAVKFNNTDFIRDFLKVFSFHKEFYKLLFDLKNDKGLDIFGTMLVEGRVEMAKMLIHFVTKINYAKAWLIGNFNRYDSIMKKFISNCPDQDFLEFINLLDNNGFFEKIFEEIQNSKEEIQQRIAHVSFTENNNDHRVGSISSEIDLTMAIILRLGEIIRDQSFLELEFDNAAAEHSSGFFRWCLMFVVEDQELMSQSSAMAL